MTGGAFLPYEWANRDIILSQGTEHSDDGTREIWLAESTRFEDDHDVTIRGSGDSPADALADLRAKVARYYGGD